MTLNVILEIIWTRIWCSYEERTFRKPKEGIGDLFFYLVLLFPILTDAGVFYSSTRPELFSAIAQTMIKTLGITLLILSRNLIFQSGIWGSLVTLMFLDLGFGAAVIFRYVLFRMLGISIAQYEPGNFRILPLLTVMAGCILSHFTIVRWLHKYEKYMDNPNILLKIVATFYWVPSLIVVRPIDMIDVMGKKIAVIISSITIISALTGGWICLIVRRRKITRENHYLELQTELFQEHNRILNEQIAFIEQCKGYFLKKGDESVEMARLRNQMEDVQRLYYTGSDLLDTVIKNKEKHCRELAIDLQVDMESLKLPSNINEIDFLTIFYNLFDNAMEAACQCQPPDRRIKIRAWFEYGKLNFLIENGKKLRKSLAAGLFTTKDDTQAHGFGLRIVREIVEKNGGELILEEQERRFYARVVLPEEEETMEELSCIN